MARSSPVSLSFDTLHVQQVMSPPYSADPPQGSGPAMAHKQKWRVCCSEVHSINQRGSLARWPGQDHPNPCAGEQPSPTAQDVGHPRLSAKRGKGYRASRKGASPCPPTLLEPL